MGPCLQALRKLLGPEVKSLVMLCHSSPCLFATHLYTWPFIFKTLLVLQASSGLGVESVLTVSSPRPGTGESAFLFRTLLVFVKWAITGRMRSLTLQLGTCAPTL